MERFGELGVHGFGEGFLNLYLKISWIKACGMCQRVKLDIIDTFNHSIEKTGSRGTKLREIRSYEEQLNGLSFLIIGISFDRLLHFDDVLNELKMGMKCDAIQIDWLSIQVD